MDLRRPPTALIAAYALLIAATVALTMWVAFDDVLLNEDAWVREVQAWAFPGDTLSKIVRAATTTPVVLITGSCFAVALWLAGARREALALAAILVVLPLAQSGIKDIVDRPRPSSGYGIDVRASAGSPSFPAGHVMSPTVLYGYLLALCVLRGLPGPLAPLTIAVAIWSAAVLALTGIVNVWLGVHWPSDALGGYLWGAVIVAPALWLVVPGERHPKP
jgi:undecaprenyl-diphosphatase